jgi:hypothetical protein
MQTTGKTKGEQIFEVHGKTTSVTVKDISQTGIKAEYNSQDQFTGKVKGQGVTTVSVWLKTDGTAEWESKGMGSTNEGDFLAVWGKGTGKNTSPTTQTFQGEMHFMSQSPKLSWLNSVTGWMEGIGDSAKNDYTGKIFLQK